MNQSWPDRASEQTKQAGDARRRPVAMHLENPSFPGQSTDALAESNFLFGLLAEAMILGTTTVQ